MSILDAIRLDGRAVLRAAGSYLTGLVDPRDEDTIHVVECPPDAEVCHLTPVILVHGFAHNWSAWDALIETLRAAGYVRFVRVNYDSVFDSPSEIAGALAVRVHEVFDRLPEVTRIHLVGHSLGGAVVRTWAVTMGGAPRVGAAVTLGGVMQGTPWARFPVLPSAIAPLAPSGHLVDFMNQGDDDRSNWTSIAASEDFLVPQPYALLRGATHHVLDGVGHVGLVYHQPALNLVRDALLAQEP